MKISTTEQLVTLLKAQAPFSAALSDVSFGPDVDFRAAQERSGGARVQFENVTVESRGSSLTVPKASLEELSDASYTLPSLAFRSLQGVATQVKAGGLLSLGRSYGLPPQEVSALQTYPKRAEFFRELLSEVVKLPGQGPNSFANGPLQSIDSFLRFMERMPERSRELVADAIKQIENPTAEQLEANGRRARQIAFLSRYPELQDEAYTVYVAAEELSRRNYYSAWTQNVPGASTPYLDSVAKLAPDNYKAIFERVRLPEEEDSPSAVRAYARTWYGEKNLYGFGNTVAIHSNVSGFMGDKLLPQRTLRSLALSGGLRIANRSITTDALPRSPWRTAEDLVKLSESNPTQYDRIIGNIRAMVATAGFRVAAPPPNKDHHMILGLDDALFFEFQGQDRSGSSYGTSSLQIPVSKASGFFVGLSDDVRISLAQPETIIQYAGGLISLHQFREFILDHTVINEAGEPQFLRPRLEPFLFDDPRWELQLRGAWQIEGKVSR